MSLDLFSVTGPAESPAPFLCFEIAGQPTGKGRPRFRYVKPKDHSRPGFVHTYTPPATVEAERAIGWKAKAAMKGRPLLTGPLAMRVFAMMAVPKSWPKRDRDAALTGQTFHTSTPDGDNIFKLLADSLNGVVYADDKQIVRHAVFKEYAENPGIICEIYLLP